MVRTTIFSLSAIIIAAPAIQANFLDFDFEEFLKEYDFKFTSTTAEPTTEEIDFNANARSYGPADFEALKFQVNGPFRDANDDQPCRDLQADTLRNLENTGYLDCMFPKINNSSDFERVTTDCAGQPLDASQAWYRPKVPFQGKPNSLYYASMVQGKPADNHQFCTDTDVNNGNMPLGSMSWCPWNQTEAAWMWHHHPAQPFQASTSQSINTLYTGIWAEDNSGNADKKWFCGQGIEDENHEDFRGPSDHKFFNWADGEPNFGKHRSVHFQMLVPDMVDARPSKTGYFYCELNCDLLTICEALACERNDASCVDTGDLATSECVCNDNALTWNPNTKTCSDDTTTEPTTTTTTTTEETTTTTTEETTTTTTEETTTTTEETTTTTEETTTTTEETTTTTTEEPTTTTTTTTDFTTTTNATTTTTDETSTSTEEFTSTTTTVPEYLTSTTSTTTTDEPTTTTTDYTTTTTSTTSTTTTEEPTTTTTTTTDFTTTTNATTTTEEPTTDETSTTEFTTSEEITTTSVEETTTSTTSTESTTSEIAPTSTSAEETTSTTSTTTTTTDATSTTSTSTTEEVVWEG